MKRSADGPAVLFCAGTGGLLTEQPPDDRTGPGQKSRATDELRQAWGTAGGGACINLGN